MCSLWHLSSAAYTLVWLLLYVLAAKAQSVPGQCHCYASSWAEQFTHGSPPACVTGGTSDLCSQFEGKRAGQDMAPAMHRVILRACRSPELHFCWARGSLLALKTWRCWCAGASRSAWAWALPTRRAYTTCFADIASVHRLCPLGMCHMRHKRSHRRPGPENACKCTISATRRTAQPLPAAARPCRCT